MDHKLSVLELTNGAAVTSYNLIQETITANIFMFQLHRINGLKNRWRGGIDRKGHSLVEEVCNLPRVDLFNHFRLLNPAYTVCIEACSLLQDHETTPLRIYSSINCVYFLYLLEEIL